MASINKIILPDGNEYDIEVLTDFIEGTLPIEKGGTDATDLETAKINLGIRDQIIQTYPINDAIQLSFSWLSETDGGEALIPEIGTIYILLKATNNNSYLANTLFRWNGNSYIRIGSFDLSDRLAKGVDNQGNAVIGAVIEGSISGNSRNIASGSFSHAEGLQTTSNHKSQHVFGEYNIADPSVAASTSRGNYVEIVGNGSDINNKSNARTLDWSGNQTLSGSLTIGAGTEDEVTITPTQLKALLALLT